MMESTQQTKHNYLAALTEDVTKCLDDADILSECQPIDRGGYSQRVKNRVTFPANQPDEVRERIENALTSAGLVWLADSEQYVVLGLALDLVDIEKHDLIHVNNRRGPFRVCAVYDHGHPSLKTAPARVTLELVNEDTGTDWLIVDWSNESAPWLYVKTPDKQIDRGYRFRKVEDVIDFAWLTHEDGNE